MPGDLPKKRLAIGDIHGRDYWKNYLSRNFEEFYILGDYFDSFYISFKKQYKNFIGICETARRDSRIKLCLGNHDYHYLDNITVQRYSGFQDRNYLKIQGILEENIGLLRVIYRTEDNILVSHAGLSRTFMKKAALEKPEDLNGAFTRNRDILTFDGIDIYGDDACQSPIWIRPRSLLSDAAEGFDQIVGHTPIERIKERFTENGGGKGPERKIVFINTEEEDTIYEF
jgi:hypothetical protein